MTPGLVLRHGLTGSAVLDELAAAVSRAVTDPFAMVPLCVPDPGTQRWASQGLARRLGVCAGVEFTSVPRLLRDVREQATGLRSDDDPWRVGRLAWSTLEVLDESRDEEWARVLTSHLPAPDSDELPGRRLHAARRLSRLLLHYVRHRPSLLAAWAQGRDEGPDGRPLGPAEDWQPELWRRLVARVAGPDPLERQRLAVAGLERVVLAPVVVLDPPPLAALDAELVAALAGVASLEAITLSGARDPDHRLVARLGRHAGRAEEQWRALASRVEVSRPDVVAAPTLLGALQSSVRGEEPPRPRVTGDRSVSWHRSHGPDRQVEVLRDALLRAFDEDPTLEPRDAVVLCPDLATFAPHLTAAFGVLPHSHASDAHRLRVRIADPTLHQLNPVLATLGILLDLATTRADAAALLDLCAHPPVATRFGFSADDLERLATLVAGSGIRWGIDAEHRRRFGLADVAQNTWVAGIDRMLVGVAMDEGELTPLGAVLPLDDVPSNDVELVGRLAELIVRVRDLVRACGQRRDAAGWVELLRGALESLTDTAPADAWQTTHAWAALADLADDAPDAGPLLGLGDVRLLVADLLAGREPRVGHGTGSLVVCQPGQLTRVPHRLVALLGFDEAAFPRPRYRDGDDLLAGDPQVLDSDSRSHDRSHLLDAVLAATERLIVVHQGRDPRTNDATPAPVPLAEVEDALRELGGDRVDTIIRQHRLQPFAPDEFDPTREPSYDAVSLEAARALVAPQTPAPPRFAAEPLPPYEPEAVTLTQLAAFLKHPVREMLNRRGGLRLGDKDDHDRAQEIPIDPDGLERWTIGTRLMSLTMSGADLDQACRMELRRGELPPGELGVGVLRGVHRGVVPVLQRAARELAAPVVTHDIALDVAGVPVRGRVETRHGVLLDVSNSWPGAKHLVDGWVRLLALTVAEPGAWTWRMIAKDDVALGPIPRDFDPRALLEDLVRLYLRGMREPLPLPIDTGLRFAEMALAGADMSDPGRLDLVKQAYSPFGRERGDVDEAWRLYWPDGNALLGVPPRPEDGRADTTLLGVLARRVWSPILQVRDGGAR